MTVSSKFNQCFYQVVWMPCLPKALQNARWTYKIFYQKCKSFALAYSDSFIQLAAYSELSTTFKSCLERCRENTTCKLYILLKIFNIIILVCCTHFGFRKIVLPSWPKFRTMFSSYS